MILSKIGNTTSALAKEVYYCLQPNARKSYSQFKTMPQLYFIDYFQLSRIPWNRGRWTLFTHDLVKFRRRLDLASNGILKGFHNKNVVLGGGSIVTLLRNDLMTDGDSGSPYSNLDFDLDLFVLQTPRVLEDIKACLDHFSMIARQRKVQIHFIVRGMLIEVLIPNERRVQILCTKYNSPEKCLYMVDLTYVQIYYDWNTVRMSYLSYHSFRTGTASCLKVPLKDIRVEKTLRKGFQLRQPLFITVMDKSYRHQLSLIDNLKRTLDCHPTAKLNDTTLNLFHSSKACYGQILKQIDHRWNVLHYLYHEQHHITADLGVFDQNLRIFSFNIHHPPVTHYSVVGHEGKKSVVGQFIETEFSAVTFLSNTMLVTCSCNYNFTVELDEDMTIFLQELSIKFDASCDKIIHDKKHLKLSLTKYGSRCYDRAERPLSFIDEKVMECSEISFSFIVVLYHDRSRGVNELGVEIIDIFVTS